jgi:membrane-associated protease RseP (regulator of RpoE activity)
MLNVSAGEKLILESNIGNKEVVTIENSDGRPLIGLTQYSNYYPCRIFSELVVPLNYHVHTTLEWIYIVTFGVAIFNMLIIYPLDGDKLLSFILKEVSKKRQLELRVFFNAFCFWLISMNIVLSFSKFGLISF